MDKNIAQRVMTLADTYHQKKGEVMEDFLKYETKIIDRYHERFQKQRGAAGYAVMEIEHEFNLIRDTISNHAIGVYERAYAMKHKPKSD